MSDGLGRGPWAEADLRIALEGVTLRVGSRRLLPDTSWTIRAGEQWVLTGANGAGKSSLAGALVGSVPVVAGKRRVGRVDGDQLRTALVTFADLRRDSLRAARRDEARAFAGRLGDEHTVARHLAQDEVAAGVWLGRLGLEGLRERPQAALSDGERRLVAIVRALARRPHLLVLDEPFEGLDAAARGRLQGVLVDLLEGGCQMVLVTHRREDLPSGMTHRLHLGAGRVAYCGPLAAAPWGGLGRPVGGLPGKAPTLPPLPQAPPAAGAPDVVRLEGVTVTGGGRRILRNLHWRMRPGEHWGVCGPNGAGKTTLLKLISGDHPQVYANRVTVFGRRRGSGATLWEHKRPIALVGPELQTAYSGAVICADVVLSGFFDSHGLYRRPTPRQAESARRWAEALGVAGLLGRPFGTASGGEQRLVLLARAMVKHPALVLLDEPCQGLDGANRARVLAAVEALAARGGMGIVYVTHRPDEWPACLTHRLELTGDGGATVTRLV